jgi:hypothetical protein
MADIAGAVRRAKELFTGEAAARAGREWASKGISAQQKRVMEEYLQRTVPEITNEQFRYMTDARLAETYLRYGGAEGALPAAGAHTESIQAAVRNATSPPPKKAKSGSMADRVAARRNKPSPREVELEEMLRGAVSPTADSRGGMSGGGLAAISADQIMRRELKTPSDLEALRRLALRYNIQNPDGDPATLYTALADKFFQDVMATRRAPSDAFADHIGRQQAEGPELGQLEEVVPGAERPLRKGVAPDRDGEVQDAVVPYVPTEVFSDPVPKGAVNAVTGEPLMQDLVTPVQAVAGYGKVSAPIPLTDMEPQTRRYYAGLRGADGTVEQDMSKELTLLVRRRKGSDGNRSDAERKFVLPLDGDRFQLLEMLDDGSADRTVVSRKYLQGLVDSGGWVHSAGPEIVAPTGGGWTPERAAAAGRRLFEYSKPGQAGSPANIAAAVSDMELLSQLGNGELFKIALQEAGNGRTIDGNELLKSAQNAVASMTAEVGPAGMSRPGSPVPTGAMAEPPLVTKAPDVPPVVDFDQALSRADRKYPKLGETLPGGALQIGSGQRPGFVADTLYGPSSLQASPDAISPADGGEAAGSAARLRMLAQYLKAPQLPASRAEAREFQKYLDDLSRQVESATGSPINLSAPAGRVERLEPEGGAVRWRAAQTFSPEEQAAVMAAARLEELARASGFATSRGNSQARALAGQAVGDVTSGVTGDQYVAMPPMYGAGESLVSGTTVDTSPILDAAAGASQAPRYDVLDAMRSGSQSYSGAMPFTTVDGAWAAGRVRPDLESLLNAAQSGNLANFTVTTNDVLNASPTEVVRGIQDAVASGRMDPKQAERWARYGIPSGKYFLPSLTATADNPKFTTQGLVESPQYTGMPGIGSVESGPDGRRVELVPDGSSIRQGTVSGAGPRVVTDDEIIEQAAADQDRLQLQLLAPFKYADRVRAARSGLPLTAQPEPLAVERNRDVSGQLPEAQEDLKLATEASRALKDRARAADASGVRRDHARAHLAAVEEMLHLLYTQHPDPAAAIKLRPAYARLDARGRRWLASTDEQGLRNMRDALVASVREADAVASSPQANEARAALERAAASGAGARARIRRVGQAPYAALNEGALRQQASLDEYARAEQQATLAENPNPNRHAAPETPLNVIAGIWRRTVGTGGSKRVTKYGAMNAYAQLTQGAEPVVSGALPEGFVRLDEAAGMVFGGPSSGAVSVRNELRSRLSKLRGLPEGDLDPRDFAVPKSLVAAVESKTTGKKDRRLPVAFAAEGRLPGGRPSEKAVEDISSRLQEAEQLEDPAERAAAIQSRANVFSGDTPQGRVAKDSPLGNRHRLIQQLVMPNQGKGQSMTTNTLTALRDLFGDDFSDGIANLQRWDAAGNSEGDVAGLIYAVLQNDAWARDQMPPADMRRRAELLAGEARMAYATSAPAPATAPSDASARGIVEPEPSAPQAAPAPATPMSRMGRVIEYARNFLKPRDLPASAPQVDYPTPMDALYARLPSAQDIQAATPKQLERHLAEVEIAALEAQKTAEGTGGVFTGSDVGPDDLAAFLDKADELRTAIRGRIEPAKTLPDPTGYQPPPEAPVARKAPEGAPLEEGRLDAPEIRSASQRKGHPLLQAWRDKLSAAAKEGNAGLQAQLNRQRPLTVRMRQDDATNLFSVYTDPFNLFGSAEPGTVRTAGAPRWSAERRGNGKVEVSATRPLIVGDKRVEPSRTAVAEEVDYDAPIAPGDVHVDLDQNGRPVAFHSGDYVRDARGRGASFEETPVIGERPYTYEGTPFSDDEPDVARTPLNKPPAPARTSVRQVKDDIASTRQKSAAARQEAVAETGAGVASGPETANPPADGAGRSNGSVAPETPARRRAGLVRRAGVPLLALYGGHQALRHYGPDVSGLLPDVGGMLGGAAYAGDLGSSYASDEDQEDTKPEANDVQNRIRQIRRARFFTPQNPFPR